MKALVGAFNQEKALVGAFSMIVQRVVEPMDSFTALVMINCSERAAVRRLHHPERSAGRRYDVLPHHEQREDEGAAQQGAALHQEQCRRSRTVTTHKTQHCT